MGIVHTSYQKAVQDQMNIIVDGLLATMGLWPYSLQNRAVSNANVFGPGKQVAFIDVRSLLDGCGNPPEMYDNLIDDAIVHLKAGRSVVICCALGRSRSNAIAIGVLVRYFGKSYVQAQQLIFDRVPGAKIHPCHLDAVQYSISTN